MKKKAIYLIKLLTVTLIMVHIVSLLMFVVGKDKIETHDQEIIIYKLGEDEHPDQIAEKFDLKLLHLKPSGIATFKTTEKSNLDLLLDSGFSFDKESYVFAPPWQRTTDKFINEQYALNLMGTKEAWNITVGISSVKVAIIDTGIDINHEEFTGRISPFSYNSVTEKVGIEHVRDDFGHGTMVAGIIGATKDNGKGIAGIAQNIELLVIKANNPNLGTFNDTSIIDGIYYAVNQGAKIINLSLGGSSRNQVMINALIYAEENGVLVVAASGNDGALGVKYPAAYDQTVAVSAVDQNQTLTSFSNFGEQIDLSAPGNQIITTAMNNGYVTSSGTSFAAPQVAGVAALMYSYFGNISLDEVKSRLYMTAIDLGSYGKDDYYGHGMVHTNQALTFEFIVITFETFLASKLDPIVVRKGTPFLITDLPILEDHVFEGFYLDPEFTILFINHETIIEQDQTLYAKFTALYHQISLMDHNLIIDQIIVSHGDLFDLPNLFKEGYEFLGWSTSKDTFTPYQNAPIIKNLILYAHFREIIFYQVFYVVFDEIMKTDRIKENEIPILQTINQEGYTWIGWFLDSTFETPYINQPIKEDTTLYARLDKNQYIITFHTMGGDELNDLVLHFMDIPKLPIPTKASYYFIDWYLDELFQERYEPTFIVENLTLYARFENEAIKVTYFLFGDVYQTVYIGLGEKALDYIIVLQGYQFLGWYYDESGVTPYLDETLNEDTHLYAKVEHALFHIIFYASDLETILYEYHVFYGTKIDLPIGPEKQNTTLLTFTFISWSHQTDFIQSNMHIYPIYEITLDWTKLHLNPGKDTVFESETWTDGGINNPDQNLIIIVFDDTFIQSPGKYQIKYQIYYQDTLLIELFRIIRVIHDPIEVDLRLNPSVDTIFVNDSYIDEGIFGTFDAIMIESNLNTSIPGLYQITYWVLVSNNTYQLIRYIHVLEKEVHEVNIIISYFKKEDYHEIH
jgi:uncharacterized repeat protein (TIGR02543 family)